MAGKCVLNLEEIYNSMNGKDGQHYPSIDILVLRNVTLEPNLELYLRFYSLEAGYSGKIRYGKFNNMFSEAVQGDDRLLNGDTDYVLVFLSLNALSPDLGGNFTSLAPWTVENEKQRIADYINSMLAGMRKQTGAVILWHSFEISPYPSYGIADYQNRAYQNGTIGQLNSFLRDALARTDSAYYVDMNLLMARIGSRSFYDTRYLHMGCAPYSMEASNLIAFEDFKFIKALNGRNKKCLILDCDNVLWGGILDEDGMAGIELGTEYPGSAFYEFQKTVLNLFNRGVIIALCSKNNESDVLQVLREHSHMVIREEHIAGRRINWRNTFLLSCRALGRRVEDAFLSYCVKLAVSRGAKKVLGIFRDTGKNNHIRDYYGENGFRVIENNAERTVAEYDVGAGLISLPDCFREIDSDFYDMTGRRP